MYVLGIHGGQRRDFEEGAADYLWHDSTAVLVKDYEVIAAVEQERLNRVKHSNSFPADAVRFCLEQGGVGLDQVDAIALNLSRSTVDLLAMTRTLENRYETALSGPELLASVFQKEFGADVLGKLRFCNHHLAHAFSAYYATDFDRSLVVTLDGDGDGLCGMVLTGQGDDLRKLREYPEQKSLGNWYVSVIRILGYSRFDEYKVMGLAPYGDPKVYGELFRSLYKLLPNGEYDLLPTSRQFFQLGKAGMLAHIRQKGEPFTQVHKDLAAALQAALEEIALHILRHFQRETREDRLCLAGGVAHNCSMNGRILYSGLFKEVFVQPAAHDAGTTLGAAWSVLHEAGVKRSRRRLQHLYLGPAIGGNGEVAASLHAWRDFLTCEHVDRITERVAQLLADGAVVGWVQGRSEFGPRALGNRSILADPRPSANKERINRMVKKREGYRPFAPSVQQERACEFFVTKPGQPEYPFMIFVLDVQKDQREHLGAITHVDGTARVHTVAREVNPRYWELLDEFGKLTGVPMLLNTSFNNNAEPIVDSVEDSIVCYLTTGIDYLVIGDHLIQKRPPADLRILDLAASVPRTKKLVRISGVAGPAEKQAYSIDSMASAYFGETRAPISQDLFRVLCVEESGVRLGEAAKAAGIKSPEALQRLAAEVHDLWTRRMITLRPRVESRQAGVPAP
jgi:carbamoyltransferase